MSKHQVLCANQLQSGFQNYLKISQIYEIEDFLVHASWCHCNNCYYCSFISAVLLLKVLLCRFKYLNFSGSVKRFCKLFLLIMCIFKCLINKNQYIESNRNVLCKIKPGKKIRKNFNDTVSKINFHIIYMYLI